MVKKFDVSKEIVIHLVSDSPKGWAHTHGLAKHGLPELEIRDVPLFLGPAASRILNQVANHMLHAEEPIKLGDTMAIGSEAVRFAFEKLPLLDESHSEERWTLTDAPLRGACVDPDCKQTH